MVRTCMLTSINRHVDKTFTRVIFVVVALRKTSGKFILNGDFIVSVYRKVIQISGVRIEYSGSDNVVERINCTKMIHADIELLVSGQCS